MSVVFDPEIRSSSEEIISFILQQLKLSNRTADYETLVEYQDDLIIDIQSELDKCKSEGNNECLLITGNNTFVCIHFQENIVFYRDSFKNCYIFYNPHLQLVPFSLSNAVKGEGLMITPQNDIILGFFSKNCIPQNIEVIDTIQQQNSSTRLSYDERGVPQNSSIESLLEKEVLHQIKNVKAKQQETSDGLLEKQFEESKSINYLALFQQFLTYWKCQKKMYQDLFGNKIIGQFDNCVRENIPIIIENAHGKTIYILNNICIVIDHIVFAIQFFSPLQFFNSADMTIANYLNEIFCKEQPYSTTFMLNQLCFVGSFRASHFEDGNLIFKQTNNLTIKYHPDVSTPYFTTISYNNIHFYQGYIFQGMYNGQGQYSNRKQILYQGVFENNFLSIGQIFFDAHQTYLLYEGQVIYDLDSQTYLMHGYGKCVLKNKTVFEGQFERNVFNGKGKITYKKKKAVYEGFFRDGIREGPGIFKSKKICFEGEYRKGLKYNYGKQIRNNGREIYEGEFKNDKRNGVGVVRFPQSNDVIFYQGEFSEDKRHGEGVEITRHKQKYLVKYYKDQCIRRKQVRLDTEECLFHFDNEEKQKKVDEQEINLLNQQGIQQPNQNQDYSIQYYKMTQDQHIIYDSIEQNEEHAVVDSLSPIMNNLQNNLPDSSPIFQTENKQQQQSQFPKFYQIF